MVAAEESYRRDGRFIEIIGFYDPLKKPDWAEVKTEAVLKWLSRGAQPTDTVKRILAKAGVWSQWRDVQSGKTDVKAVADARPRASLDRGRKPRPSKKAAAKMKATAGAE
jgi:small subunit ribosomal protein S16